MKALLCYSPLFVSGFCSFRNASYEEKNHYLIVNQTMLPFEEIDKNMTVFFIFLLIRRLWNKFSFLKFLKMLSDQ